jgi:hypothetical protein
MVAQRENTRNLIEFAIRYFHEMAATNRYHVRALLEGISLGIRTDAGGAILSALFWTAVHSLAYRCPVLEY